MNTILGSVYPFTTITFSAFVLVCISTSFRLRTFLTFSNLSRGHTTVSYSMCIHSHHKIYSRLGAPSVTFSNVLCQIVMTLLFAETSSCLLPSGPLCSQLFGNYPRQVLSQMRLFSWKKALVLRKDLSAPGNRLTHFLTGSDICIKYKEWPNGAQMLHLGRVKEAQG